jgi:hypothetical protein
VSIGVSDGCGYDDRLVKCASGQLAWQCAVKGTPCHTAYFPYVCASNEAEAIAKANESVYQNLYIPRMQDIVGTTCDQQSKNYYYKLSEPPGRLKIITDDPTSCAVSPDDDACVTCVKTSCCTNYQACFSDLNCSCIVGCLYQGFSAAACASMDQCGPPSAVTLATGACLQTSCPASCPTAGGMATSMCSDMGTRGGGSSCQAIVANPGAAACLQCAAGPCCNAYAAALAGDPGNTPTALQCWAQHSLDQSVSCSPPPASAGKVASFNACMFEACLAQCDGSPYAGDAGP